MGAEVMDNYLAAHWVRKNDHPRRDRSSVAPECLALPVNVPIYC